jgi:glutamyl-tRNA reductase
MIGPIMDRTINFVLQASKTIKTQTQLSTGTVSVSYAAIEWLKKEKHISDKKILLFGTGKFGTNVVKNLKHYFKAKFITAINRTNEAANKLALEADINWKPFNELAEQVKIADIIIVCTNAGDYTILPSFFIAEKEQLIFDLSVPANVHPDVRQLNGITLVDIDEVSQIMQKTFARRNAEIPKALEILNQFEKEFYDWLSMYQHSNLIQEMKFKLFALTELQMPACEMANSTATNNEFIHLKVNKAVNSFASNLRVKKEKGCQYINTFHEFLKPSVVE